MWFWDALGWMLGIGLVLGIAFFLVCAVAGFLMACWGELVQRLGGKWRWQK
jgi:hypothetical protein